MTRLANIALLPVVVLLTACGGSSECRQTGDVSFQWTPSTPGGGPGILYTLPYRLGQRNQWTLSITGVTAECREGLVVTADGGPDALPPGFALDAGTGTISTDVLASHVEGYCTTSGDFHPDALSTGRVCPEGQSLEDIRRVVRVRTKYIDANDPYPITMYFRPAP